MNELTLQDAQVQRALNLFLAQARICAETPHEGKGSILGIAAMCTVFPCLFSVGEALARRETDCGSKRARNSDIILAFYTRLTDKVWLIHPDGVEYKDADARKMLGRIRLWREK